MHVWVTDTEEYGKIKSEREKVTIQCAKCESAGEVEDEDFTYDYSGIDHDKLQ